ncbi:MAG TPA: hypothetical protein VFC53_05765 [Dehalococcoidia bacterium]|nr:hypothetical protein [Dehalococcoidia bacterium]
MESMATAACVHHWVLGTPEDEVVRGRCKRCGMEREYPASLDFSGPATIVDEVARPVSRPVRLVPDREPGTVVAAGSGVVG